MIKQVIVLRTKYPHPSGSGFITPRKGKLIAQACHASMMFMVDKFNIDEFSNKWLKFGVFFTDNEIDWLRDKFTKICVRVDSEEQLLEIHQKALDAGLTSYLVTDAGLTEFGGVPTNTCIAIGPHEEEKINPITGELKLL